MRYRDSSPHRTSRSGDNAIHGLPPFLRLHYPLPREACQATPQVPEACGSMQSLTVNVLPN